MVFRSTVTVHPLQQLRDEVDRLFTNVLTHPTVTGAARLVSGARISRSECVGR